MAPSDRRNLDAVRTFRPEAALDALPTVAEAIEDPAFVAGNPEVIAGHGALGNRVRWVHASDNTDVARFFAGGELLLTTAQGWPDDDAALAGLVRGLSAAGIAGIVLELGSRFAETPVAMVEAAASVGLPLVVLRSEVRFVDLTEAIHRRIIGSQMEALRAHAEVRERFTALALRGAPADHVVSQLARTLSSPVILENLAHAVITAEVIDGSDAEVLADWERRSRAAAAVSLARTDGTAPATGDADWLIVPVDARGTRWGNLVALPGAPHPAGRLSVLEQGAIALAIGCLAASGADEWNRISRRGLLEGLLEGRFATAADAEARLEASGLPVAGRVLYGIAVTGGAPVTPAEAESAARAIGAVGRALPLDQGAAVATVVLLSLPGTKALDPDSARALLKALGDGPRTTLTIGRAATGVDEALASMRDAIDHGMSHLGADATATVDAGGRIRWADERPLAHLLNSLRDDYRLLDHGERMLAPIIEHDARTGGDLELVLAAMLGHPSNRTAAAKASHLSRSVFYQRLSLIASLLDADLDDGETQTALHIALLAHKGRR